jgi:amidase
VTDNLAFISKTALTGSSQLRLAVKDMIDVAGFVTTAGSQAIADRADAAQEHAECVSLCLAGGAEVVGKTNLHELAIYATGINPWFGTPRNPLDASLIPGGSSSGSAVAVACDEADVALGTDTGGSIRIPAACCGVTGLKPTYGRVSLRGVRPLAPSLDTVGPMARDISMLTRGWELLNPHPPVAARPARLVGRIRTAGVPAIEQAIDSALRESGLDVTLVDMPDPRMAHESFSAIFDAELWNCDHSLLDLPEELGDDVEIAIRSGAGSVPYLAAAQMAGRAWRTKLLDLFQSAELLVLPTIPVFPPTLTQARIDPRGVISDLVRHTSPFNLAGLPALALPIPVKSSAIPASMQLVGPPDAESALLETAANIESAVGESERRSVGRRQGLGELGLVQARVRTVRGQQLSVRAVLDDLPVLHDQDEVGVADRG